MKKYILTLDEGTTSARAIIFDECGSVVSLAQNEFTQIYPQPSYVEHDPIEILSAQYSAITYVVTCVYLFYLRYYRFKAHNGHKVLLQIEVTRRSKTVKNDTRTAHINVLVTVKTQSRRITAMLVFGVNAVGF